MSKPAAFRATFADLKVIKTRQCVQIIFEVPTEQFDSAYEVLGGLPNPAAERWFAVAAIQTQPERNPVSSAVATPQPVPDKPQAGGKRDWNDLPPSQQAALRCNSIPFRVFLREERADDWRESAGYISDAETTTEADRAAECVRLICGVGSRRSLNTEHSARVVWKQLDDQFQAWERVGA